VTKKGISSIQLALELGVNQKTAWFMLHRIRENLKENAPKMLSQDKIIESDETYVGGKEKNRHYAKKLASPETGLANDGTIYNKKKVVIGAIERGGRVVLKHISDAGGKNVVGFIKQHVPLGSRLMTDEHTSYSKLYKYYIHGKVNHSIGQYVIKDKYTNTIESFWSILKRGINGTYIQVSSKYLDKYLSEFAERFNTRKMSVGERFELFLSMTKRRLLFKNLING
jgi:hypothetical protein